jgi:hypothetical protein
MLRFPLRFPTRLPTSMLWNMPVRGMGTSWTRAPINAFHRMRITGYVSSAREFSKKVPERKGERKGNTKKVPPGRAGEATKERKARLIEDYTYKAPKTTTIRVVACAAAVQVCLAVGFAPAFWTKLHFLDVLSRGLFITSLVTGTPTLPL